MYAVPFQMNEDKIERNLILTIIFVCTFFWSHPANMDAIERFLWWIRLHESLVHGEAFLMRTVFARWFATVSDLVLLFRSFLRRRPLIMPAKYWMHTIITKSPPNGSSYTLFRRCALICYCWALLCEKCTHTHARALDRGHTRPYTLIFYVHVHSQYAVTRPQHCASRIETFPMPLIYSLVESHETQDFLVLLLQFPISLAEIHARSRLFHIPRQPNTNQTRPVHVYLAVCVC